MLAEPLRASDFRVVSFQAGDEDDLAKKVNEWLQQQSADVVVYDMMFGHAMAVSEEVPGWSFSMTIAYGNRPRSRGVQV